MCGVLGICGDTDIKTARNILQLLVHRGQDASGLAWVDDYGVHKQSKSKGAPLTITIPDEKSSLIIGSTRYPTSGNREGNVPKEKYAQPFAYQTKMGTLSLCHNGNITNIKEISNKTYQSDAEFITEYLGKYIDKTGNIERALFELSSKIDGSYSIVGIFADKMFCFRDPRGIRPLIFGKNETHFMFASESICMQQSGMSFLRDVNPGEFIIIDNNKETAKQLVTPENISHCFFEYVYFANSASVIDGQNVYSTRLKLGKYLAEQLKQKKLDIDYVVPVPDTSKSASQTLSEYLNIPLREAIMKNRSSKRTFIMPNMDTRELAARAKYLFIDKYIKNKKLLIVDDSIVRGLTTKYLIKVLRQKGAKEVHVAITSPPQRYACYYGVDFGTDKELIAKGDTSINIIKDKINADSLTYISEVNLIRALNRTDLCTACINAKYPTKFGKILREKINKGIIMDTNSHYE